MDLELRDKRVLVTGASRGIGLACVEGFLEEGATVTLVSRPSSRLGEETSRLAARYPEAVASIPADLSTADGIAMLAPSLTEADVVVNNAGAERFGDESRWPEALAHLPFGRAALPVEIANLAVFVASSRASYLSGVVIDADAGAMYTDASGEGGIRTPERG